MPRLLGSVLVMMLILSFSALAADQTLPPDSAETLRAAVQSGGPVGGLKLDGVSIEQTQALVRLSANGKPYTATLSYPSAAGSTTKAGPFAVSFTPDPGDWPKGAIDALTARLQKVSPDIWRAPGAGNDPSWMVKDLVLSAEQLLDRDEALLAGRLLNVARHLDPKSPELGWALVRLYAQSGDSDASRQAALALPLTPDSEVRSALEAVRRIVFSDQELSGGEVLQDLAVISPDKRSDSADDPACEVEKMAALLDLRGKPERANQLRLALIKAAPRCELAWSNLGLYMMEHGQAQQLLDLANAALAKSPDIPEIVNQQARALRRLGKPLESMASYEKLYGLTHDQRTISLFSSIASQDPRNDAVFNRIKEKAEAEPDNLLYRHAYGVMSHYRHDYPTALRLMDELRPKLPTNARVYIYGAMSRYEQGDWDGALSWLKDLEKIGTADPDIWYCLAVLYHQRDKELSLKYIDKYLAIPPDPDEYQPKRQRAIEFRGLVEKGERVKDWEPHALPGAKNSGCAGQNAASGWLVMLLLGAFAIRRTARAKCA